MQVALRRKIIGLSILQFTEDGVFVKSVETKLLEIIDKDVEDLMVNALSLDCAGV
jgi:hypothetical protein